MIKIEFPADRTDIAAAIGRALLSLNGPDLRTSEGPKNCRCVQVPVNESDAAAAVIDADTPENRVIPHAEIEEDLRQLQAAADLRKRASLAPLTGADGSEISGATLTDTDDVAIGPRPGSVFADPAETVQALGKDLDAAGTLPQVDPKGVAFYAAMCGISAKPFYETGKTSGQWKKRRGVDQAAYDAWYAEQLEQGAAQTTVDTAPVDTAGAFGTTDTPPTEPEHTHAPTTFGDYMVWASAKQNAGLLTQDDIGASYAFAGLSGIADLLAPNDDAVIAERVAILYAALSAKAGA